MRRSTNSRPKRRSWACTSDGAVLRQGARPADRNLRLEPSAVTPWPPVAVYDANVLYPDFLRDVLLRLAIADLTDG